MAKSVSKSEQEYFIYSFQCIFRGCLILKPICELLKFHDFFVVDDVYYSKLIISDFFKVSGVLLLDK